jgi:FtsP/CotA-like multicopper oxidase with cupredoxin domain/plastocyanin
MSARRARARDSFFSYIAVLFAGTALFFACIGLVAVSTTDAPGTSVSAAAAPVPVTLSEFKITPATINAVTGDVQLSVHNGGTMAHNLSVAPSGKRTPDIQPGGTAVLDLGNLAAGSYQVQCLIPGHADSGMKATLVVADASSTGAASGSASMAGMDMSQSGATTDSTPSAADYAAMDQKMADGMKAGLDTFTKGNSTKGVGNQKLAPTIEPDGTKVFNLDASIVDWEVSPGKTVKAWAYNGIVPGPWIRTEPNDKVKVVIKNDLPVSTDIHFHGITTPFPDDGVSPLTQDPIKPGDTYTYSWTNTNHPELGMYHAHMNGQEAVVNGMFAVFQVGDVPLPKAQTVGYENIPANLHITQELPMVLNDAGTIGLSLNGKAYPATAPVVAKPGDAILVHYYNEGLQAHPMHLHHLGQIVIAKDGYPLAQPYEADTILVGPGERYSVLILPTTNDIGVWAWHCHILTHAESDSGLTGMVTALIVQDPTKQS